jgi:hypothetical protein
VAITQTPLTSGSGSGASPAIASITTVASRLTVLNYAAHPSGGPKIPTITGWTLILSNSYDAGATGQTQGVFGRIADGTGAHNIDFGGESQDAVHWSVSEYNSVVVSGGVAGAYAQAVSNAGSSANASVSLAAFGSANNATIGLLSGVNGLGAITQGSGFSEIHELVDAGTLLRMQTQWRNDNDQSVDWANSAAVWGAIGIELKDAGPVIPTGLSRTDRLAKRTENFAAEHDMRSWYRHALILSAFHKALHV